MVSGLGVQDLSPTPQPLPQSAYPTEAGGREAKGPGVCVCILGRGTSLMLRGISKVTKCSEPPITRPSQDPGIQEGQEEPTA